jgi:NitT/TauT family transport system substrate-binding protein/putative hydroxymethylpyrimidine transport system substrate-binding protein
LRRIRPLVCLLIAAGALAGLAGCGDDPAEERKPQSATLVLDFLPNGVHAGIYQALASGAYLEEGIDLKVITPTSTADTIRLIQAGKADFGLADSLDVAGQIGAGRDVKAVMAVTQRPSGGLVTLARENILSPADLGGKTVGVTGVPSDTAVLETMVEAAGGSPDESKVVTVGFGGIQALLAGRISAFTGYVPADSAVIEARGKTTRNFAFDEYGGPPYPGLVAFSTGSRIARDPELVEGFVKATIAGYRQSLQDPQAAISAMAGLLPELDSELAAATFAAYRPLIGDPRTLGSIDPDSIVELSDFMVSRELIPAPFGPEQFAATP